MSRYDVAGKVCLVTGAAQGIGYETAAVLHARGATVALLDVDGDRAARAAAALDGGERAFGLGVDVRDRAAMADAVAAVVDRCGRLDVVVANAGVTPIPATLRVMDPDDYDRVVAINQTGVFNTVHPAIEPVIAAGGHIVVVASVAAFMPGPAGSAYMITKAAVEQLGRALRIELAPFGATAGVAYFGVVETEMTRAMLDDDEFGRRLAAQMPPGFATRMSARRAGEVIADGIGRRAARTVAPDAWKLAFLLRSLLVVGLDAKAAGDATLGAMLRGLEARVRGERERPRTPA